MRLHANAALSLKKRELLARRVVEHAWSVAEAADNPFPRVLVLA